MSSNENEKINCKACNKEVLKSKIIIHITRSIDNCKEVYGAEFISMKKDQKLKRTEYLKKYHKESYNSDNRRVEYLKEKKSDEIIEEKIRKNIADKKEKKYLLDKHKSKQLSQAKWYENNSEEIKKKRAKSYDPAKRSAIYQKNKELYGPFKDVDTLLTKDQKEKERKKKWYKENAEKVKKRNKESYDPVKREKKYQKLKREQYEY